MAEDLRTGWSEEDIDPLLSTLSSLRNRRLQLEAEMRLLIAYGRCFTHPRPYKLIDLANAAGMSISGIRTAYDTDEIDQAAEILERPPTNPPANGKEEGMSATAGKQPKAWSLAVAARTAREAVFRPSAICGKLPSNESGTRPCCPTATRRGLSTATIRTRPVPWSLPPWDTRLLTPMAGTRPAR
jgi:hypothetical protein